MQSSSGWRLSRKFRPRIKGRRLLMPYLPFHDLLRVDLRPHVPGFFYCIPPRPNCFRLVPLLIRHGQVSPFPVWYLLFQEGGNAAGVSKSFQPEGVSPRCSITL